MRQKPAAEGIVRIKIPTPTLAVALALADARKQTLDEYFDELVRRDARELTSRTGDSVEWREAE